MSSGNMVLAKDTITARASLRWQPNDRLLFDFSLDYTKDDETGPAMELLGIDFTDLSHLEGLVAAVPPPMAFIHNVTTAAVGPGVPCAAFSTTAPSLCTLTRVAP